MSVDRAVQERHPSLRATAAMSRGAVTTNLPYSAKITDDRSGRTNPSASKALNLFYRKRSTAPELQRITAQSNAGKLPLFEAFCIN
jgi:hypothetical protein